MDTIRYKRGPLQVGTKGERRGGFDLVPPKSGHNIFNSLLLILSDHSAVMGGTAGKPASTDPDRRVTHPGDGKCPPASSTKYIAIAVHRRKLLLGCFFRKL